MKLPTNYTEQQVLEVIDRVAMRLAQKFKFGYYEIEDMKQQARMYGIQGLDSYDEKRPLENFLYVHIHNRLYNLKRNEFARPEKPCLKCPAYELVKGCKGKQCTMFDDEMECELYAGWIQRNEKKKSLMKSITPEYENAYSDNVGDNLDKAELYQMIDGEIPISMREDWIRFTRQAKLPKARREALLEVVKTIIREKSYDPEAW